MSTTADEIATQPELWRRARRLLQEVADLLPAPGQDVFIVGCGTSLYMAQAAASLRETAGHGRTDAFAAAEMPHARRYDVIVAISRSGMTSEVANVLSRGHAALCPDHRGPRWSGSGGRGRRHRAAFRR
ncbi:hypothetical protein [Rugosimonospora africana]|nr:hypothetical protein [Rugosimonospora africana]